MGKKKSRRGRRSSPQSPGAQFARVVWFLLETEKKGVDPGLPKHFADLRQVMPLAFSVWNTAKRSADPRIRACVREIEGMAEYNKRIVKPIEDELRQLRIQRGDSPWLNFEETFRICRVGASYRQAGRDILQYAGIIEAEEEEEEVFIDAEDLHAPFKFDDDVRFAGMEED
jgi:hypothetical protein